MSKCVIRSRSWLHKSQYMLYIYFNESWNVHELHMKALYLEPSLASLQNISQAW